MLISFSSIQLSDDEGRRESNFPFSHYTFNELCESLWSISSYGVTKHIFLLSVSCNIVHMMMKRATTRQATTTTMWREISIQYWNSSENRTSMMTRRRNSFLVDGIKEYFFPIPTRTEVFSPTFFLGEIMALFFDHFLSHPVTIGITAEQWALRLWCRVRPSARTQKWEWKVWKKENKCWAKRIEWTW